MAGKTEVWLPGYVVLDYDEFSGCGLSRSKIIAACGQADGAILRAMR